MSKKKEEKKFVPSRVRNAKKETNNSLDTSKDRSRKRRQICFPVLSEIRF